MKTYKAKARINGREVEVVVQANSINDAQRILEAQYGKGYYYPTEVK